MKKLVMLILSIMLVTSLPMNVEAKSSVKVTKKLTVEVGRTSKIKVKGTKKKKLKYSTKNKKIATVTKKGKVTGKKAGKTTIVVKVGKKSYKCKVKVVKPKKNSNNTESPKVPTKPTTPSKPAVVTPAPTPTYPTPTTNPTTPTTPGDEPTTTESYWDCENGNHEWDWDNNYVRYNATTPDEYGYYIFRCKNPDCKETYISYDRRPYEEYSQKVVVEREADCYNEGTRVTYKVPKSTENDKSTWKVVNTETIPKTKHNFVKDDNYRPSRCSHDIVKYTKTCTICGEVSDCETVASMSNNVYNHRVELYDWDDWDTELGQGYPLRDYEVCSVCGHETSNMYHHPIMIWEIVRTHKDLHWEYVDNLDHNGIFYKSYKDDFDRLMNLIDSLNGK